MKYRWFPTGQTFACRCGGTVRGYFVSPSRTYVNHCFVCDNPDCRESVSERTGRTGRLIIAS